MAICIDEQTIYYLNKTGWIVLYSFSERPYLENRTRYYEYTYNSDNLITQEKLYIDGSLYSTTNYSYYANSELIFRKIETTNEKTFTETYFYRNNNLIRKEVSVNAI